MISISNKNQEEINVKARASKNIEFWTTFISESNKRNKLFETVSPSKDSWIGCALGLSGISVNLVISKTFARSEVYFNRGGQIENKLAFDFLFDIKDKIEAEFGEPLIWERMDGKITCRIKAQLDGVSIENNEDWEKMINYLIEKTEKLVKTFKPIVDNKLRINLTKKN